MELANVIEEGDDGNNQRDNDRYVGFLIGKPETVDHLVYNKANPEQHCQDKNVSKGNAGVSNARPASQLVQIQ
jgi:hypothetical protein